ncbi:MAG: tetratricopeptide repeat protein [Paludibacteraceae bacterium]|nr:tetratricopeptide repeat protein [Paludibacteraceae bacterium]
MKKKDQTYQDSSTEDIVLRYENAQKEGRSEYFDVDDLEVLIDHYMEKNKVDTTQAIIQLGLTLHPCNTDLTIAKAKVALFIGQIRESEEIAAHLQQVEPENLDVQLLSGQILLCRGMQNEAKALFDKILQKDREYIYDIAYAYFDAGDYTNAIPFFEQELQRHPAKEELEVLFDLAYCHQQRNDWKKAVALYEKLLDEDPYSKDAWFNLGQIYFIQNDLEKATEAFDYAYIVGNDYQALLQKGNALFQSGKLQSAIESYKEYADANGRAAFVIVYIGECYEKMGDFEQAKIFYSEALRSEPTNTSALCGLCICHMEQDEYEKGLQFIDHAIEITPTLAEAWLYKAEAHLNLNDTDEALRCYKKAADLDPEMSEAMFAIGNIYIDKGEYATALEYYQKGANIDHGNDKIPLYLAITHFKLGETELAYNYLGEAIAQDAEFQNIFFEICPEAKQVKEFSQLFQPTHGDDESSDNVKSYFSNDI